MLDENSSDRERFAELVRLFREQHDRGSLDDIRSARRQRMRAAFSFLFDQENAAAPGADESEIAVDMAREMIGFQLRWFDTLPGRLRELKFDAVERRGRMAHARDEMGEMLIDLIYAVPAREWRGPAK